MSSRRRSRFAAVISAVTLILGLAVGNATRAAASPAGSAAAPLPAPAVTSPASTPKAPAAHTVTYDGYSFMVDGKRTYLWSGEFHYFRLPSQDLWRDILQKMKAAGFNAVSLYFDWGYHSSAPGVYDFTGVRDVDKLLDIADQVGIYVIARPGPYINAEVDGGGFPGWLSTTPGATRTSDPGYLNYSDQWQTQIDRIIARHQLTNGTGSVIEYQVENEYYNGTAAGRTYMKHLEDKATADGITVPLVGNNNGTFNSGDAALAVDAADSYPQGFNCSNPTKWNGVPDISYDHVAGKPLGTAEFQGGAFDPWGGPGYDKCAQLINDQFANVFYNQNIAVGATEQSFYMTYGGTNWGWLSQPENYTSYDYGAAIRETRELDPKYYQDKLIGYFTQAVAPLTKTDAIRVTPPDDAAIIDTARKNTDTGTEFHVLRHGDSTSTAVDKTHISIDFGAIPNQAYTYDDVDPALQYTGAWSHVANQSYTGGDYLKTESFSNTTGDSVTIPFTGTAVQWIGPKADNHGIADVYLDGVKKATVDTFGSGSQVAFYSASGLAAGPHTLKIVVTGNKNPASKGTFVSVDAIDVPTATQAAPSYPVVPQQPGTAITLNGRDSKIIVADYKLGSNQLQYSTSEIMTNATIAGRDVAVLYGDKGTDGETVLRYVTAPIVSSTGGAVTTTWDPATGDLRLNYTHSGLIRVQISGGSKGSVPLLLLLADTDTAKTFWRQDTAAGPVLVRGTHLLRGAVSNGTSLALTGDNATDNSVEVFSGAHAITWNGRKVQTQLSGSGSRVGVIGLAAPIVLPALTNWKHIAESPEAAPSFDDSTWQVADKSTSNSITTPGTLPVLFADDYGFHTGNTWYRGRFTSTGQETGITLSAQSGGKAAASSAWLNGVFLGSSTADGQKTYTFPAGTLKAEGDNLISVLTVDMGHEEDYNESSGNKAARGLTAATLVGAPLNTVTWRLQGDRGGQNIIDTTRGPLNTGGLFGERAGYTLPGYPTAGWKKATLPTTDTTPGVSWYQSDVTLNLPKGQDTSLGLTITDDPSRKYRAEIFVNGWQMGNYVNYVGPQHSFPVPNGVLNPHGKNDIVIAVWNLDGTTGGLGKVALTNYGSYSSSLVVAQNIATRYSRSVYAMPKAPGSSVTLQVPPTVSAGQSFAATAVVAVPKGKPTAQDVTVSLAAPAGWTVSPQPNPTSVAKIKGGASAKFTWNVTAPAAVAAVNVFRVTAHAVQGGRTVSPTDERIIGSIPPPPPAGVDQVSDLPFLSDTNGWGPVERDQSNGDNKPNDGKPLTLRGNVYAKGLGTNSPSDVQIYLAGGCSRFTATVGVDDEVGGAGTVTFSVIQDGKVLTTTAVLKGGGATADIDVPVTGGQVMELVVGDGGDGNGNDHADWVNPTLTCQGAATVVIPVPPAPVWTDACGVANNGSFSGYSDTAQYSWKVTDHSTLDGKVGIVVTPKAGFAFPAGARVQWTRVQDNSPCVIPVPPAPVWTDTCGPDNNGSFSGYSDTAQYSWKVTDHSTLDGKVGIVVTPKTGFAFPAGARVQWTRVQDNSRCDASITATVTAQTCTAGVQVPGSLTLTETGIRVAYVYKGALTGTKAGDLSKLAPGQYLIIATAADGSAFNTVPAGWKASPTTDTDGNTVKISRVVTVGASATCPANGDSVVHTQSGLVRGTVTDNHREFLDIPYAASPVGALRWAPPAAPGQWAGVRDGATQGPQCPQNTNQLEAAGWSDDCLDLNVWTPPGASARDLPVVMWIHGGAHDHSSGRIFDASRMAQQGNAVVVTINYRLGVFGNLALAALNDTSSAGSGAYGLMDQVAALHWIHSNIAAFGGDAQHVMIDGQSSGAADVCSLLASPPAAGLFSSAVIESASCSSHSQAYGLSQGASFAKKVGCTDAAAVLDCLRAKPTADILAAQAHTVWGPSIGSSYLPVAPLDAFAAGTFNHVPVIKGATHDEARFTLRSQQLSSTGYPSRITSAYGVNAPAVLAAYPVAAYSSPLLALATVQSDQSACATRNLDATLAQTMPLYTYEFDDPNAPNYPGVVNPHLPLGPTHTSELAYLFDLDGHPAPFDAAQQQLAAQMIQYWTTFARTGDPNPQGLTAMPRYSTTTDLFLSLRPTGNKVITNYATDHQCTLWDHLS